MKQLWRRLHWFLHREDYQRDLEEEMRHHLALKAEDAGPSAQRNFGSVTYWKESSRLVWTGCFWEQLGQDIRYAVRTMNANRLFTLLATLSLALGIGANTAIFSFMDAVMLRALPVRHPEQLVLLNWEAPKGGSSVVNGHAGSSYPTPGGGQISPDYPYRAFEYLRDHNHVFSSLFAFANAYRLNLVVDGQALLGNAVYVSGDYFNGLGVPPAMGRLPGPADDQPGAAPVVVISYAFWQAAFHADPNAAGKSILINNKSFSVVGVCAPEFFGVRPGQPVQVFLPAHTRVLVDLNPYREALETFNDDHSWWIDPMGRLKPGVSLARAQRELTSLFHDWLQTTVRDDKDRNTLPRLVLAEGGSGADALRRQYSKPLFVLMGMVGLILALACINLANLLLARAAGRRREMAVRLSVGAGRLRIVRQLLTESVMLSLVGGFAGLFVAAGGIHALTWLLGGGSDDTEFSLQADLNWHVLAFSILLAILTGILFGLVPALQATKVNVTPALKEVRATDPNTRLRRFGLPFGLTHVLMASQIAISLLLVAAAGLFVRTLQNLDAVALGFNANNILLFNLDGAQAGYKDGALLNLYSELQRRFRSLPAVRGVTLTQMPLVSNWISTTSIHISGMADQQTAVVGVAPGFFETMQLPIFLGRALDERDKDGAPVTAVINQVFARKYFPGLSPLGHHFHLGGSKTGTEVQIVGVAKNARYSSLKDEIPPVTYVSYLQAGRDGGIREVFFELRTAGNPIVLANTVRQILHQVCPRVPIAGVKTQVQAIDQTITQERTFAALCTCFGALALMMACVGLYATTAYGVIRRTGEFGIRMALGAERNRILRMVVKEVLLVSVSGLAVGFLAVWQVTALLSSFLFGLKAHDGATFGIAALILLGCILIAGYQPAWRASRIDPMIALRHE